MPKEMASRKDRVAVSARVLTTTKEALEKAAKEGDLTLAEMISNVLEDYVRWYEGKS
jgi:hypothetical protein